MPLTCRARSSRRSDPAAPAAGPNDTASQTARCRSPTIRRQGGCRNRGLLDLARRRLPGRRAAMQSRIDRPLRPAPSSTGCLPCTGDNGRSRYRRCCYRRWSRACGRSGPRSTDRGRPRSRPPRPDRPRSPCPTENRSENRKRLFVVLWYPRPIGPVRIRPTAPTCQAPTSLQSCQIGAGKIS